MSNQSPFIRSAGADPLPPEPVGSPSEAKAARPVDADQSLSLIYEPYYGLKEKPFSLSADPRFLYKGRSHAPAFDDLLAAIRRREGLIVLTGDIGTGKTTLCRSVLQHLDRKTFAAFVPDPFLTREDLLKMLLVDFGVMSVGDIKSGRLRGATRPDLSYPLYEFLNSLVPLQAFAVLVIDEAQNLPLQLLEEIRILSDLEGREKLLQVVLVGQLELRAHLKLPEMRQLDQRVSVRCELKPLGPDAVAGYVTHRLKVAGGSDDRIGFSTEALEAVYRGSGGVPRLINLICDRALQRAYVKRTGRIDAEFVRGAMADLALNAEPALPLNAEAAQPPNAEAALPPNAEAAQPPNAEAALPPNAEAALPPSAEAAQPPSAEAAQPPMAVSEHLPAPIAREPRGLFEKTTGVSARPPTEGDWRARLDRSMQADRFEAATPLEQFALDASEPPPVAASSDASESRRAQRSGSRWHRSPIGIALLIVALAGIAVASVSYVQEIGQFFAEPSVMSLPPPPALPVATIFEPQASTYLAPSDWPSDTPVVEPGAGATPAAEGYVIQVASFERGARAGLAVKELTDAGYRSYQSELDLGDRGRLQLVLVGRYATRAEADADLARIRQLPDYADARVVSTSARVSP